MPYAHPSLVLVGLTGAGKSTVASALEAAGVRFTLLPNRRALADAVALPEAQRLSGEPVTPVRDRLERFRLTRRYRDAHPGGLAHALKRWLAGHPPPADRPSLFDNLRGREEVAYAVRAFPAARFVVLEADAASRVLRLAGRGDAFDVAAAPERGGPTSPEAGTAARGEVGAGVPTGAEAQADLAAWARTPGLAELVDLPTLVRAAMDLDPERLAQAARVVVEEGRHYDPSQAWTVLQPLAAGRRLRLDTVRLSRPEVADAVRTWWTAPDGSAEGGGRP